MASRRLPRPRSSRGVATAEGRARGESRRRARLPRAVRQHRPGTPREGGLEETAPISPLHYSDGGDYAFRPCALADMGRCLALLRRPHRRRALRRARPMARLLPGSAARASLRSARTSHDSPRRSGTLRRGLLGARPPARARRGTVAVEVDTWLVDAGRLELRAGDCETPRSITARRSPRVPSGEPLTAPCPRERADEPPCDRGWRSIVHSSPPATERLPNPVEGGAALARVLRRTREASGHRETDGVTAAGRLPAWNARSSSRALARPSEVPRLVRRDPRGGARRARGEGSPWPGERRGRPGRPGDHRPCPPGRERAEHRPAGEHPCGCTEGDQRLQRQHRVRVRHEGGPARRPADHARARAR